MPTHLVTDTPCGDADALAHGEARLGDGVVVRLLLAEQRARHGLRDADVELGERHIEPRVREDLQLCLDASDLAENEMRLDACARDVCTLSGIHDSVTVLAYLRADPVNRHPARLQAPDECDKRIDLLSRPVKIYAVFSNENSRADIMSCLTEIVDVQLRCGVRRARGLERDVNEVFAQQVEEDGVAERP